MLAARQPGTEHCRGRPEGPRSAAAMSQRLVFAYGDKRVMARGSGADAVRSIKNLEAFFQDAEEKLGLPEGTYDFYDVYGKITTPADLQRALSTAGSGECTIEVREHLHFIRIRALEDDNSRLTARLDALEVALRESEERSSMKLQVASEELVKMIKKGARAYCRNLWLKPFCTPSLGTSKGQIRPGFRNAMRRRWQLSRWQVLLAGSALALVAARSGLAAAPPLQELLKPPAQKNELAPVYPGSVTVPKEAPISRVVEPYNARDRVTKHQRVWWGPGYGKHPYLVKKWSTVEKLMKRRPPMAIPGKVARPTKREQLLRRQLINGTMPSEADFNRIIQVFAQRARQEVRYPLLIQRHHFAKRAKGWAWEMLLNDMQPSRQTYKLMMLAFGATGHHAAARWWIDWRKTESESDEVDSRWETNCLISAYAKVGRPLEAARHLREMSRSGLRPDARSFAGVIEAWEHIGNRYQMLRWLKLYLRAEARGILGELLDPRDAGLPYYALAESYVKVADAVRTMSLLKAVKDRGIPLSIQAYRLRLDVLLRVRGQRRAVDQIERALVEFISNRPSKGPIFTKELLQRCRDVLGEEHVEAVLSDLGAGDDLVQQDNLQADAYAIWQTAQLNVAISRAVKYKRIVAGTSLLLDKEEDDDAFEEKQEAREPYKVGDIDQGFRVLKREASEKGLPDWMSLKKGQKSPRFAVIVQGCETTIYDEVGPALEAVMNKQHDNEKDIRSVAEKLAQFDLQELRELSANALQMRDEVMNCINRLNVLDSQWLRDKEELREIVERTNQDLKDLQKYIMGKIDVGIEADADLRRDQQILNERMQLIADDLRLLMEEHQRLANRTLGVVEENEEMRTLLGQVREDNEHLRHDNFQVSTRVLSLEGAASEKWQEFTPAVLYFRNWHRTAKGDDVQLSADLSIAVGRGFLAATGVVIGNTEGLAVGDGPCRHFGTPGCFSSYYEIEVDEVTASPAGAGGLFLGVSLQSGEEIANHPRKEFDGWLVGGSGKALTLRASCAAEPIDAEKLPDTFAPTSDERSLRDARKALKLLRAALPPLAKGKVEEVELRDSWSSEVDLSAVSLFGLWAFLSLKPEALSHRCPGRRRVFDAVAVALLAEEAFAEQAHGFGCTRSAPEGAAPAEARRAQFAALAAAVDLGIIGAYGSDAQGTTAVTPRGIALHVISPLISIVSSSQASKAWRKHFVAFAGVTCRPSDRPVNVIEELVNDVTSSLDAHLVLKQDFAVGLECSGGYAAVDIPSSNLDAAAAATDAALQRLPKESLPRRLAALIPDGLALPESVWNGTASPLPSFYRPTERALLAAAALSSLEVNLDGGEGFGVGLLAGAELPAPERPASLDPLFGPLGRSPVARERALDASQYLRLAISGAVCSAVVRAVLQPLEVVKTTQQPPLSPPSDKNAGETGDFQSTAKSLLEAGGFGALYKGTDATVLATGVMGFASFGLNELFRLNGPLESRIMQLQLMRLVCSALLRRSLESMTGDATGQPSALLVLGASIAAVFVSGFIAAPFETLRVRVMAPTESKFLVFDLASRGLFSLFPAAADAASLQISAVAGAIAGLASAVVSNPADAICAQFLLYDSVKDNPALRMGDRVGVLFRLITASAKHAVTMPEELLRSRAALNICRFSRSHHVAPATDMALRRLPCTQTLWALAALSAVPFCQGDCLAPVVDGQHPDGSCAEGVVISAFGTCEPRCAEGYILEVASSNGLLLCLSGQLVPSTFQCIGLNCSAPVGIAFGGEEEENHTNCEEGGSVVVHGSYCTPRCRNGYTPNLDGVLRSAAVALCYAAMDTLPWDPVLRKSILPCVAGVLAPSTFSCLGMPCQVPRTGSGEGQILNAHALRPCSIDLPEIPHLGFCDPLCRDGWHPNVSLIQCVASNLTSLFECLGNSCPAPKLVQFAEAVTCQEGPEAEHEGICTPNCKPGYRPSTDLLTCRNGVLTPFRYECFPENCTAHFELPWALPPSPGYNRSLGINSPLVEWVPPEARTCAEGPSMFHRGRCTAQCLPGYEPDIPFLSCNLGNFSPPVYQCVGQPCQALQGIPDAPAATCEEGTVLEHGGSCTTKCDYGFVPSDAVLSCNATVLDPANYTCIGTACNAPAGVANAPTMPCLEPPENLTHGSICTTQCLSGFVPSTPVLHCYGGQLSAHPECHPCRQFNPKRGTSSCRFGSTCNFCHHPDHKRAKHRGQRGRHAVQRREFQEERAAAGALGGNPRLVALDRIYTEPNQLVEDARAAMQRTCAKLREAVEQELDKRMWQSGMDAQCLRPDSVRIKCSNPNPESDVSILPDLNKRSKWLTGTLHLLIKKYQDSTDNSQSSKFELIAESVRQNLSALQRDFEQVLQAVEGLSDHLKNHSWLEDTVADLLQKDFDLDGVKDLCELLHFLLLPEDGEHPIKCHARTMKGLVQDVQRILDMQRTNLLEGPASFECIEESVWLGYEPSDDTIAQAWAENVAAAGLRDGTALACFKDELSLAIQCVVLLASVTATRQGQWSTLTGPQVEEFVLEPLTLDKAVACYRIAGGSTMCRALELVSESLVQGAEVLLSTAETYHISLASLADGAAVCFQQGLDTWRCRLLDVGSSSSLSMGPELLLPGTLSELALASLGSARLVACGASSVEGRSYCHLLEVSGSMLSNISSVQVSTEAAFLVATRLTSPSDAVLLCFSDWSSVSAVCKMLEASGDTLVEAGNVTVDHGVTRYLSVGAVSASRALLCMERQGPLLEHCMDRRLQCEDWAAAGECGFNPKFMFDLCPQTCGVCTQVGPSQGRCHVVGMSDGTLQAGREAVVNDGISWNFAAAVVRSDTALVCFSDSTRRDAARCRTVWGPRNWDPLEVRACSENVSASCVP
ncbi:Mitochondrial phosphate carrier protein [Symbiodinium microadriaticum]|uniref:Mitochondrial phosphate carrier protein n=1 Tax=Symbiodinium microadriaticum TaxID=2951 RepID=A0A1Q9CVT4_SYMMI|nr:Mitochondrial phosphate carrier protein [Symbiodinium microadriaticum]